MKENKIVMRKYFKLFIIILFIMIQVYVEHHYMYYTKNTEFYLIHKIANDNIKVIRNDTNNTDIYAKITDIKYDKDYKNCEIIAEEINKSNMDYSPKYIFYITDTISVMYKNENIFASNLSEGDIIKINNNSPIYMSSPAKINNIEKIELLDNVIELKNHLI